MRRQTEASPLSIAPIERDLLVAAGKDAVAVGQAWERWNAATELDTLSAAPAVGVDPRLDALILQRAAAPPRTSRAWQVVLAGVQAAQEGANWLMAATDLGMVLCGATPTTWVVCVRS